MQARMIPFNSGNTFFGAQKRARIVGLATLSIIFGASVALAVPPADAPSVTSTPSTNPGTPAGTSPEPEMTVAPKEVVKTGTIAASVRTGQSAAVDADTSGETPGDESNAIGASIGRAGKDVCVAKVTNNGKKTYSISFNVVGEDRNGGKPLNQYFSATLKPKSSVEKQVTRCDPALNLSVVLKSAKALK